jgi:hypothetical protein
MATDVSARQNGAPDNEAEARAAKIRAEQAAERRRLIARGSDMTLANQDVLTVVFTPRLMAKIEDDYGSLNAYWDAIGEGTTGKWFHHLTYTLELVGGYTHDEALDLIDPKRTREYMDALGAALLEAMPAAPEEVDSGNGSGAPAPSPGPSSSTSPSSSSASRRRPSGTA